MRRLWLSLRLDTLPLGRIHTPSPPFAAAHAKIAHVLRLKALLLVHVGADAHRLVLLGHRSIRITLQAPVGAVPCYTSVARPGPVRPTLHPPLCMQTYVATCVK